MMHREYKTKAHQVLTPAQKQQLAELRKEARAKNKQENGAWKKEGHVKKGKHLSQELSLTAEQQKKLSEMRTAFRARLENIQNDNSISQDQKRSKMHDLRKERREQMQSLLTPEQLEKMKEVRQQRS